VNTTTEATAGSGTAAANPATETRGFAPALSRVQQEIEAMTEAELVPINIDIASAAATVLGALPEIERELTQIAGLPRVDHALVRKLGDYAGALMYTHGVFRAAAGPADNVAEIAEKTIEIRDQLLADATALGKRGFLDMERVDKLRSGLAYKQVATDVTGLVSLLREHWPTISNRTALTVEDLNAADVVAEEMIVAIGLKEQAPAVAGAAALTRQKAFTLFSRAYDETRRALEFLYYHSPGRADEIAPSLYQGRGGRRVAAVEAQPQAPPPAPATPNAQAPSGTAPNPVTPPVPVGLPGSSPFRQS
jgi:hypothetical protein